MSQTYINGRIHLTSLAAPSEEDKRILNSLSEEDRRTLIAEALERAETSGTGERTPEQIWEAAKARASQLASKHAV